MKIVIHQPNYLPWLGFFDKINLADCFVILDDAKMSKSNKYLYQRKIKCPTGALTLSVPLKSHSTEIRCTEMADSRWKIKHFKTIKANYSKSEFFKCFEKELAEIYKNETQSFSEFNTTLIKWIMEKCFNITSIIMQMLLSQL